MIPALATVEIPLVTVSEANRASHELWTKRHKRAKQQNETVVMHMLAQRAAWDRLRLPLTIVLVRHGVGELDTDNLGASLKHVQDGVTDALGLYLPKGAGPRPHNQRAPGFAKPRATHYDDRDRLSWHYAQHKCKRGHERVDVRFYEPGCVSRWLLSKDVSPEVEAWAIEHSRELDALLAKGGE